jgi:hypothetical protein
MKKTGVLIVIFLLFALPLILNSIHIVAAADQNDFLPPGTPTSEEDLDKLRQEYLSKEWDKILLDNKDIGPVYGFLKTAVQEWLRPIFIILFAEPFVLNWAFIFVLVIWIIIYSLAIGSLRLFIDKSKIVYLIALSLPVILAQAKFFRFLSEMFISLFFLKETWYTRWAIIAAIIIGLVFIYILQKTLLSYCHGLVHKRMEEKYKKINKLELEKLKAAEKGREDRLKIKEQGNKKDIFDVSDMD